jgi:hypothetical protein
MASFSAAEREHWKYLFQESFPGSPASDPPDWHPVPKRPGAITLPKKRKKKVNRRPPRRRLIRLEAA